MSQILSGDEEFYVTDVWYEDRMDPFSKLFFQQAIEEEGNNYTEPWKKKLITDKGDQSQASGYLNIFLVVQGICSSGMPPCDTTVNLITSHWM